MSEGTNIELVHRDLGIEIEKLIEDRDRYKKLAKEFYPYVEMEAAQATILGPSIHDCDPSCPDCQWYNWGIKFKQRIENGEFNEINSQSFG